MAFVLEVGDLSVGMHSENLWQVDIREVMDVVLDMVNRLVNWAVVVAARREPVVVLRDEVVILEDLEHRHEQLTVEVVGNSASVVNLAGHKLHCVPRNILVFQEEVLHHGNRGDKIGVTELIEDVPAQRTKLAALLDHCVEERETEQQIAPLLVLRLEGVRVRDRHSHQFLSVFINGRVSVLAVSL